MEKPQDNNKIKCFDCGTMLETKDELMKHKREQHWKQKNCPYFHGEGRRCRFPNKLCFNIHRQEEQGAQGQTQGARGLSQGARGHSQGARGHGQGTRGQQSWATVAGGQGEEGRIYNARKSIECRDGNFCSYFSQGECRYQHSNQTNQTLQTKPAQQNPVSEYQGSEASFNMQEMKLTLENLVKVLYNLKYLADFPPAKQTTPSQ